MSVVKIYTDGACLGNPGDGGWGYIINFILNNQKYSDDNKQILVIFLKYLL